MSQLEATTAVAKLRNVRISPQKVREVVNLVRDMRFNILQVREELQYSTKKAAKLVSKVLDSALANAENNHNMDIDAVYIDEIYVDAGATYKRVHYRARGRMARILKRTSHITVKLKQANI